MTKRTIFGVFITSGVVTSSAKICSVGKHIYRPQYGIDMMAFHVHEVIRISPHGGGRPRLI